MSGPSKDNRDHFSKELIGRLAAGLVGVLVMPGALLFTYVQASGALEKNATVVTYLENSSKDLGDADSHIKDAKSKTGDLRSASTGIREAEARIRVLVDTGASDPDALKVELAKLEAQIALLPRSEDLDEDLNLAHQFIVKAEGGVGRAGVSNQDPIMFWLGLYTAWIASVCCLVLFGVMYLLLTRPVTSLAPSDPEADANKRPEKTPKVEPHTPAIPTI